MEDFKNLLKNVHRENDLYDIFKQVLKLNNNEMMDYLLITKQINKIDMIDYAAEIDDDETIRLFLRNDYYAGKSDAIKFKGEWQLNQNFISRQVIPFSLLLELKTFVNPSDYTLYRGFSFDKQYIELFFDKSVKNIKKDYQLQDSLNLHLNYYSSWSTDYNVAYKFSQDNSYNLVVCTFPKHESIITDINNIPTTTFEKEKEVILQQGDYTCKIVYIGKNGISLNSMNDWDKYYDI
jgi:hypothetical protein